MSRMHGSIDALLQDALPGFLAWDASDASRVVPTGSEECPTIRIGPIGFSYWGLDPIAVDTTELLLSRVRRRISGSVEDGEIRELIHRDPTALTKLLPPFAAAAADHDGVTMLADTMGFRPLFHSASAHSGTGVLSTSALLAGYVRSADIDHAAVAIQSLLGWQLGDRTILHGIHKLAPGAIAHLAADGVKVKDRPSETIQPVSLEKGVAEAADILRASMGAILDDYPEAVLQLTGGLDSRLLLSAIPTARRKGLHAMTLGVPGSHDVAIAAQICDRYGLQHEVHGMSDLADLEPAEAWELCRTAAIRLDGMSDPVALAALGIAERRFAQGVRISGLGGEVARGFYYTGRVHDRRYTRKDAEQLAAWRMFVNDAVEPGVLTDEFLLWARNTANSAVYDALCAGGDEWFRATDSLYLRHRMQRWAGATDNAVGYQRIVVNPMLDHDFIRICGQLRPVDMAQSRFLAALQMELDPELGRRPLDGRPSPSTYAQPSPWYPVSQAFRTGMRFASKASQRLRRVNRPPAGGEVFANKVVERWRDQPDALDALSSLEFLCADWINDVIVGRRQARPSTVGFLTNLIVATGRT